MLIIAKAVSGRTMIQKNISPLALELKEAL